MTTNPNELKEILHLCDKHNISKIPTNNENNEYKILLDTTLKKYYEFIMKSSINNSLIQDASQIITGQSSFLLTKELGNGLLSALDSYLDGNREKAHITFNETMNKVSGYLNILTDIEEEGFCMYRMRHSKEKLHTMKDIFHIPFNQRHKVSTQRYSIEGVPSLYLSDTSETCLVEIGKREEEQTTYCSKMIAKKRIVFLDLTLSFELFQKDNTTKEKIQAYFLLYPLLVACSFKTQYSNASFNMEYIIPNLLIQWIANNYSHIDGICYFSTKGNQYGKNYILPSVPKRGIEDELSTYLQELIQCSLPKIYKY